MLTAAHVCMPQMHPRTRCAAAAAADSDALYAALTAVKGIGPWSVDMFKLFHRGSPDVLPLGDLGVRKARAVRPLLLLQPLFVPAPTAACMPARVRNAHMRCRVWVCVRGRASHTCTACLRCRGLVRWRS